MSYFDYARFQSLGWEYTLSKWSKIVNTLTCACMTAQYISLKILALKCDNDKTRVSSKYLNFERIWYHIYFDSDIFSFMKHLPSKNAICTNIPKYSFHILEISVAKLFHAAPVKRILISQTQIKNPLSNPSFRFNSRRLQCFEDTRGDQWSPA